MGLYIKPSEKELVKNPEDFGYVCSVCEKKYKQDFSKTACETWHELEARREE
jgi:hypothetical protein